MRDEFQHFGNRQRAALPQSLPMMICPALWIPAMNGFAAAPAIGQRRVCTTETITDLAYQAALAALENSGCRAEELNLIICATMTADDGNAFYGMFAAAAGWALSALPLISMRPVPGFCMLWILLQRILADSPIRRFSL